MGATARLEGVSPRVGPASEPLWLAIEGSGADVADVGAKAATLDRLIALGAPVPPTAALTSAAFARVRRRVAGAVEKAAKEADPGSDEFAGRVEKAFARVELPAPVVEALDDTVRYASDGRWPVAVRSSATAEDLDDASFAGQYRTELNVEPSAVEAAVRRCWASLWSPRACSYRQSRGIDDRDLAMAVVLQAMVPAEQSGVAFTVDPTGEYRDVVRVESVHGLGEAMVSGDVTPDVLFVPRSLVDDRSLSLAGWQRSLTRYALRAERAFGAPQDLEWSVTDDGTLFVLQARPVTASAPARDDGFDDAPIPGVTWTPLGVAEMLPGVMPPLLWTINGPLLDDAFRWLYARLGVETPPQPLVARFRGQAALNLSVVEHVASRVPGGSVAEVQRQYIGEAVEGRGTEPLRRAGWIRRARTAMSALRLRRQLVAEAGAFLEAVHLITANSPDLSELPPPSVVEYRHAVRQVARVGYGAEVGVAAAAAAAYRGLELTLRRWIGDEDEAAALAQGITAGAVGEHAGGAAVVALNDIAAEIADDDAMCDVVTTNRAAEIPRYLADLGDRPARLADAVLRRARRAGCTTVYGGMTWDESDDELWPILQEQVTGGRANPIVDSSDRESVSAARTLRTVLDRVTLTRKWRLIRVLTGQIVDLRRRMLRRLVGDAREFLRLREELKSALLRLGGEERRVIREIAAAVDLDDDDVWMCTDGEFDAFALGEKQPDAKLIRDRRDAIGRMNEAPPLPDLFTGPPPEESGAPHEGELRGRPASAGVATGKARPARTRKEAAKLEHGEILVGSSTDPSWTPLFGKAAAIVMERGGPLSHAAIVARELDVPAVLGVESALATIKAGARVRVDGARGTVEILDDDSGGSR